MKIADIAIFGADVDFLCILAPIKALNTLIEQGNTILVIEHNMDMIKCADWVIDIGPEGGDKGGYVVFEGKPEDLLNAEGSYTGQFLKAHLK